MWSLLLDNAVKYSWNIAGAMGAVVLIVVLVRMSLSDKYKNFDLVDLVIDTRTNRISDSKFRLNGAFILTSFVLIYITLNDKLTEWYVTGFLSAWVIDRWGARNARVKLESTGKENDNQSTHDITQP